MVWSRLWQVAGLCASTGQCLLHAELQDPLTGTVEPEFAFSEHWNILGPFQLGTREAPWGADPLEFYGGFCSLEYDPNATFKSSLAFNGTVSWTNTTATTYYGDQPYARADLTVEFPDIDWDLLKDAYGWPAWQWQGWARGSIFVKSGSTRTLVLNVETVLEYWIDDQQYFGGDYYGFGRVPVTLHLEPGYHRTDVRLIRDIRVLGSIGKPIVELKLELVESGPRLGLVFDDYKRLLIADAIGGGEDDPGVLASPYASITIRNDGMNDIYVHDIKGMPDKCKVELMSEAAIKLVPGQTRPIAFRWACAYWYDERIHFDLVYRIGDIEEDLLMHMSAWPTVLEGWDETHKITFLHPGGMVSYAMLRPPSLTACEHYQNQSLPIIIALHGAGTSAESWPVKTSFDPLPDLCAWVLFPSGVTPWSGDDWHYWGFADVEAAVAEIPDWIERVEWKGPGVNTDKWLVAGHSNGGQGVWYAVTHRPDKIFAAAALSGFSSIQSYVPYTFWHTVEPAKEFLVQAALMNYRHGLLLENTKGIPIFQQHGSLDDNVPAYQSRFLSQRIEQAGAESTYFEVPGAPHYWNGVVTTEPLSAFYREQKDRIMTPKIEAPTDVREFSIVVANPGDMGPKNGVEVLQLVEPERLGRLDGTFDPMTGGCLFSSINILSWRLNDFDNCDFVIIDGQKVVSTTDGDPAGVFKKYGRSWRSAGSLFNNESWRSNRSGRQLGAMDAILRSNGTFQVLPRSKEAASVALQVSRNLCQYHAADTAVTHSYEDALSATGNLIGIGIGGDIPYDEDDNFPIRAQHAISIRTAGGDHRVYDEYLHAGVAAAFLRPLPDERLELVIWGVDKQALEMAARLVPMMTGSGQPDFIVADRKMLWKGLEGALALGFFDHQWNVSRSAFFT